MDCDLDWFLGTPFGACYTDCISDDIYDAFLCLAEDKLCSVKKWCPKVYKLALAIQIALMLETSPYSSKKSQVSVASENPTGKIAVVKKDKVYDVEREYVMTDVDRETAAASPAAMLADIIDRCKAPAMIGARLVRSHPPSCGCGRCKGKGVPFLNIGDKADT